MSKTIMRSVAAVVCLVLAGWSPQPIGAAQSTADSLSDLRQSLGADLVVEDSHVTGAPSMVRAADGVLLADDATRPPTERALDFLATHGDAIGLSEADRADVASVLRPVKTHEDLTGQTHVRLDQTYRGLDVFGAQVVVHMDTQGIRGVNGTFVPVSIDPTPRVSDARAEAVALRSLDEAGAETSGVGSTELAVYRVGLIEGVRGPARLAWAVETDEFQVWVDARNARVLNTIPLHAHAKDRVVHTPDYDPENPDLFAVRKEHDPVPNPVPMIENLFIYSGQVYDLFANTFGFDSYLNDGGTMRTVYLINNACPNAYWDGYATNYCPGFDLDDVVAHEWGHAYTDGTHNLIYQCQPGALNESYSDIWGEVIDLLNDMDGIGGSNNDAPYPAGQRWLVGEDLTDRVHRLLLRDMWDPARLNDPDRVGSALYTCGPGDNEGVHTNSGIPNHAFAMLTDGKTFRGTTVEGIGLTKASHIYWQAGAAYQTYSSSFSDHADALRASCADLTGLDLPALITGEPSGEVIDAHDCAQVDAALKATQMDETPLLCRYVPQLKDGAPAACEGGTVLLAEDFEDGLAGWTRYSEGGALTDPWPDWNWEGVTDPHGRTGTSAFAINADAGNCRRGPDITGRMWMDSPAIEATEGNLTLRFDHYVATRRGWDGGNVKVSVNGGEFTTLPQEAYVHNAPREALGEEIDPVNGDNSNPLAGEFAWTGTDQLSVKGSWGTTVADLAGIVSPGDTVVLRFDFGVNCAGGIDGWYVDDVSVTACPAAVEP